MATSNAEENNGDKFNDLCKKDDSSDESEDSDTECSWPLRTANKPDAVSMFCKNCFTPYSGEQKSGTFVLKCQVCGLTDTVLEEDAPNLDADEYVGNLMMNKFFQVLRDQESVNLNIGDPGFTEDNYRNIADAVAHFSVYLNSMKAKLLEVSVVVKCGLDKNMAVNEGVQKDGQEGSNKKTNETNSMPTENPYMVKEECVQQILALRLSVLNVIEFLMAKYKLPSDIWLSLENRLKSRNTAEQNKDTKDKSQHAAADTIYVVNNAIDEDDDIADTSKIPSTSNSQTEGATGGIDVSETDTENIEAFDQEKWTEYDGEGNRTLFGMQIKDVRAKLDDEIYGKLGSKFMLNDENESDNKDDAEARVETDETVTGENNDDERSFTNEEIAVGNEISKILETKFKFCRPAVVQLEPIVKSVLKNASCMEESLTTRLVSHDASMVQETEIASGSNTYSKISGESTQSMDIKEPKSKNTDIQNTCSEAMEPERFEVTFGAVSSAFVHELQELKKDALMKRKKKALEMVGAKLVAIKQQVKQVERQIKRELNTAYKTKLQKTENQKKNIAENQEKIGNAEELLQHYMATGQMDKVAEVLRFLQSANQKN